MGSHLSVAHSSIMTHESWGRYESAVHSSPPPFPACLLAATLLIFSPPSTMLPMKPQCPAHRPPPGTHMAAPFRDVIMCLLHAACTLASQVQAQGVLIQAILDKNATAAAKAKTLPKYLKELWNSKGAQRESWLPRKTAPASDFMHRLVQWFDEKG